MKSSLARLWAHLSHDARDVRRIFPDPLLEAFEQAVIDSERSHGAELRIAIEAALPWRRVLAGVTPRERAIELFSQLRVWDTEANNGVLLYVLLADQAIELIADRAALVVLGEPLMQQVCAVVGEAFRDGRHHEGLREALARLHEPLVRAFPHVNDDEDELPNRPVVL